MFLTLGVVRCGRV